MTVPTRVLIAEDSAILRDGLVQLLVDRGFVVTDAVSEPEALRRSVATDCPDVAIIDIRMPPTFTDEGLKAAIELRGLHKGLGILLFSQYIETRYAAELLAGGAAGIGYLLKDRVADVSDFVEALGRVAAGGTALDPEVVTQLLGASRRAGSIAVVNDAHRGAKEAIVELRDLARGIHPPALDMGLEGALSTLAARSTIPTELTLALSERPTPAIESIAYFCVAELMANVAQHANASRASITCAQHGPWLRLVVRDDGTGGAQLSRLGSSSSGLIGLSDRVHAVDGRLDIVSPLRGPTVVTIDLPLHA
jgi:DNA-binding NarL/FixJ family response regulator